MRRARGDFFAIDATQWRRVCYLGLNQAVAYLVLARFSGRSQQSTLASTNAVEKYTSISRHRAKAAIAALEASDLVSHAKAISARKIALSPSPDFIWLPNAIVTGAKDETPPIERLRQAQDIALLWLFVELYRAQNLASDGGIHWKMVRGEHERREVARQGAVTIWGFNPHSTLTVYFDAAFLSAIIRTRCTQHASGSNGEEACCRDVVRRSVDADFFPRFRTLQRLGLISLVPHLVEADSPTGEVVFPFDMNSSGEKIEADLATAAHAAALALVDDGAAFQRAKAEGLWLVPLPAHIRHVQLFDLARLRYRPRTSRTLEWHSALVERCSRLIKELDEIKRGTGSIAALATSM